MKLNVVVLLSCVFVRLTGSFCHNRAAKPYSVLQKTSVWSVQNVSNNQSVKKVSLTICQFLNVLKLLWIYTFAAQLI